MSPNRVGYPLDYFGHTMATSAASSPVPVTITSIIRFLWLPMVLARPWQASLLQDFTPHVEVFRKIHVGPL